MVWLWFGMVWYGMVWSFVPVYIMVWYMVFSGGIWYDMVWDGFWYSMVR